MIELIEENNSAEYLFVLHNLREHNQGEVGDSHSQTIMLVIRNEAKEIIAGLALKLSWQWAYVELLWVDTAVRGQGLGARLLSKAEAVARGKGAGHIHLDTFDERSNKFYVKNGYGTFGKLQDYPSLGKVRHYLVKKLR